MAGNDKLRKRFSYGKEFDVLTIHNGFEPGEKFNGNIDVWPLILDMSSKGKVKGIELFDATRFLSEFGVSEEFLESLQDAELNAKVQSTGIIIGLVLKGKDTSIAAKIVMPKEMPEIVSPSLF